MDKFVSGMMTCKKNGTGNSMQRVHKTRWTHRHCSSLAVLKPNACASHVNCWRKATGVLVFNMLEVSVTLPI
jgi:hypothetical protein